MSRARKVLAASLGVALVAGAAYAITFVTWRIPTTVGALNATANITTVSSNDAGTGIDDSTSGTSSGFHLATTTAGPIAAGGQSFPLNVTNAYQGYRTGVNLGITATGTTNMKLQSITLVQTSGPALPAGSIVVKFLGAACTTLRTTTESFVSSRVDFVGALSPGASYGFDLVVEVVPETVQNLTTCQTYVAT